MKRLLILLAALVALLCGCTAETDKPEAQAAGLSLAGAAACAVLYR